MKLFFSLLLSFSLFAFPFAKGANGPGPQKIMLSDGWFIKSSAQVKGEDKLVSTADFEMDDWFETKVPSTVLGALIKNKVYPDTRIGTNEFLIPDVSDEFNAAHDLAKYSYLPGKINPFKDPYWYRTEFKLPEEYKGRQIWLNFNGINYRADVWLNGEKIADKNDIAGMFCRYKLNITKTAKPGLKNFLAVKIYQVDHPGTPTPGTQFKVFGPNRGVSEDIFKDETLKFSGGWDCAPVVRDRNMGIYQDVFINATGPVSIENPYIVTKLPLPDTTEADIKITAELKNTGSAKIEGVLSGEIDLISKLVFPTYTKDLGGEMPPVKFSKNVSLEPGETKIIELSSAEFPQLKIKNPYLWWPNGYGKQYLHNLKLEFVTNNAVSDAGNTVFGIRQITNSFNRIGDEFGRVFNVNGKSVFCKGGWIQSEILQETDVKRAYDEARLLAEANVNMIANEDAPAPPEFIMETYDKYGIMVWETFFQCWRMYPGSPTANNPLDHKLALKNAQDIIKRYRNNPSLVLWCAACEVTVCEDIYTPLKKMVKELDPARPFIPASSIDWDVDKLTPYIKDELPLGMTDNGSPDYNWNPEIFYFNKTLDVKQQMFRNELGVPSIPNFNSLKKFIPEFSTNKKDPLYPLDSVWAHHGAWDANDYCFRKYDSVIRYCYGFPSSVEEYARKAQYVNANSYRAMYEAAAHKMWDITSGVMLWKLNDCWPSVLWQLYDWYHSPNAAYYFAKKAMKPLHIQLNANNFGVSVINACYNEYTALNAYIKVYDINMKEKWSYIIAVNMEPNRSLEIATIPRNAAKTDVYFVELRLADKQEKTLDDNFYWFSSKVPYDYTMLDKLTPVDLNPAVKITDAGQEYHIEVKLKNNTGKLSFFNRLIVTKGKNGDEVNPVFWSDNFVTLSPGAEKILTASVAKQDLDDEKPFVKIDNTGLGGVK
jgi:hypothetical protein